MWSAIKRLILKIFNKRTQGPTAEEQAFNALVEKFAKIQYLVDQKAMVDVIEKAPVGICITNKKYIYEYVNAAYCAIYGYKPEDLIGNSFTMVVPPENQQQLMDLHDQFMDQEYELEGEWKVVDSSGKLKSILANAAYVVDEHRRPKKITFVLDITPRAQALEALQREKERRGDLELALDKFVCGPLTNVADSLEQLGGQEVNVEKIRDVCTELTKLLEEPEKP